MFDLQQFSVITLFKTMFKQRNWLQWHMDKNYMPLDALSAIFSLLVIIYKPSILEGEKKKDRKKITILLLFFPPLALQLLAVARKNGLVSSF